MSIIFFFFTIVLVVISLIFSTPINWGSAVFLLAISGYAAYKESEKDKDDEKRKHKKDVYELLFSSVNNLTPETKHALMNCLEKAEWVSEDSKNVNLMIEYRLNVQIAYNQNDCNRLKTEFEPIKEMLEKELNEDYRKTYNLK